MSDEGEIRRQPVHRIQLLRGKPAGGFMFQEGERTGLNPAGEAAHGQMKIGIIVFHLGQFFSDKNLCIQFFHDFPGEGFFRRFAGFDFSAGEFPEILPGPVAPAGGENPALMGENGGDHPDGFLRRRGDSAFPGREKIQVFLRDGEIHRKIIRGGADKSFGVHVARLAGVPHPVIVRAHEIQARLEVSDINQNTIGQNILGEESTLRKNEQMDLFEYKKDEIIQELQQLDVMAITPMDAMNRLFLLREKARKI